MSQKGFTLVEGLLITLTVAVIGFGGFYTYNQTQASDSEEEIQSSQAVTDNKPQESTPETADSLAENEVIFTSPDGIEIVREQDVENYRSKPPNLLSPT